jgi:hypothetical protein
MKAVTINISLNPELAEFARADAEARAFDSMCAQPSAAFYRSATDDHPVIFSAVQIIFENVLAPIPGNQDVVNRSRILYAQFAGRRISLSPTSKSVSPQD